MPRQQEICGSHEKLDAFLPGTTYRAINDVNHSVCVCEGSRYGKCQPLNYRMNYIAVEKSQQSKEMINSLKGWKTFAANILTRRQNDDDTTEKFKFQF